MYQLVDFDTLSVLSEHPTQEEAHEAAVFAQEKTPGLRVFVMTPGALHSARRRRGILWDRDAAARERAEQEAAERAAQAVEAARAAKRQSPASLVADATAGYEPIPGDDRRERGHSITVPMDDAELAALDALRRDGEPRAVCVRRLIAALNPEG